MKGRTAEDVVLRLTNLYRLAADQLEGSKSFPHPRLIEAISYLHHAATLARLADGVGEEPLSELLEECSHVDVVIQFPHRKPGREWDSRHHVLERPTVADEFSHRARLRLDGGDRAATRRSGQDRIGVHGFARALSAIDRRKAREGPAFRKPPTTTSGAVVGGRKRKAPTLQARRAPGQRSLSQKASSRKPQVPVGKSVPRAEKSQTHTRHTKEGSQSTTNRTSGRRTEIPHSESERAPTRSGGLNRAARGGEDRSSVAVDRPQIRPTRRTRAVSEASSESSVSLRRDERVSTNVKSAPAPGQQMRYEPEQNEPVRRVTPTPSRASRPRGQQLPVMVVRDEAQLSEDESLIEEDYLFQDVVPGGTVGAERDRGIRFARETVPISHDANAQLSEMLERLDALAADRERIRRSWGRVRYADVPAVDPEDAHVSAATVASVAALPMSSEYSISDEMSRLDHGFPSSFDADVEIVDKGLQHLPSASERPRVIRVTNDDR